MSDTEFTDKALSASEVAEKLGVSIGTIWRWVRLGDFPKGRAYSSRIVRWLESDVDSWIQSR